MSAAITSKEHYELMAMFERANDSRRLDREDKALWPKGHVYQHDATNDLFLAFRQGYAFGIASARQ